MSAECEIKGQVKAIGVVKEFGSNGFTKRNLLIETPGEYSQDICLELHKDRTAMGDVLEVGEDVTCHVNIRCNEHNGRYYPSLVCWKIDREQKSELPKKEEKPQIEVEEDEIPF